MEMSGLVHLYGEGKVAQAPKIGPARKVPECISARQAARRDQVKDILPGLYQARIAASELGYGRLLSALAEACDEAERLIEPCE